MSLRDPAPIEQELRAFVAAAGRTRALPVTVRVGTPGGEQMSLPEARDLEQAMRTDLVSRALDGLSPSPQLCAWLTRTGALARHDVDAAWFAAARAAFARHGVALPHFYVLNRTGWVDLVDGSSRVWSRVRTR